MRSRIRQHLEYIFAFHGPALARHMFPDLIWRVDCDSQPVLYLTFDDGPTPHLTPILLEILARNDVRATFFLLGKHIQQDRDSVRRIEDGGHTVALHGYQHLDAWKTDPEVVLEDLNHGYELLSETASTPVRHFRPPFGRFRRETRRWAGEHGLRLIMWDLMPGDYMDGATDTVVAARIHEGVRRGSIIVLHDSWNPNVENSTAGALKAVIPALKAEGWRFEGL